MKIVPYFALGQFSSTGLATSFALFPWRRLQLPRHLSGADRRRRFLQLTNVIVLVLGCELTGRDWWSCSGDNAGHGRVNPNPLPHGNV